MNNRDKTLAEFLKLTNEEGRRFVLFPDYDVATDIFVAAFVVEDYPEIFSTSYRIELGTTKEEAEARAVEMSGVSRACWDTIVFTSRLAAGL